MEEHEFMDPAAPENPWRHVRGAPQSGTLALFRGSESNSFIHLYFLLFPLEHRPGAEHYSRDP
jgi:hypothetical protein